MDIKFRVRKTKEPVVFDLLQTGLETYSISALGSIDKVLIMSPNEEEIKGSLKDEGSFVEPFNYTRPADKYDLKSWVTVSGADDLRTLVPGLYGELVHQFWAGEINPVPASFEMVVTV